LQWSPTIAEEMGIPMGMLPDIRPSSQIYGYTTAKTPFGSGIPIAGVLGDQQAAMAGQACFAVGNVKNTYGTGCFMLLNTGNEIVRSSNGLLTTVCYQFGEEEAVYALEGSIAVTGSLVQWLRDNLGLIETAVDIEACAKTVEDNGDVYFVPAFSGLFAPYWRDDARGAIVGLTRFANKGHICRAALEATAFQTRELLDAMRADLDVEIDSIKVDGGMVHNELLMQFQADVLGIPTVRPKVAETTALGAAYAAGLAVGFWEDKESLRQQWQMDKTWQPSPDDHARTALYAQWKKAVTKTFNWK
jgi:glycerol kinase